MMMKYNKIKNIIGMIIPILIILLCCCININSQRIINMDNHHNISYNTNYSKNTPYNTTNYSKNTPYNTTNYADNTVYSNNSLYNTKYIKYPKIINYTVLEYGKYSERDNEYYYSYIDKLKNRTIVFIYGGKRPVDYNINIIKVIKNSNNNVSIYIERAISSSLDTNGFIITSPYIILEINGTFEIINIKY